MATDVNNDGPSGGVPKMAASLDMTQVNLTFDPLPDYIEGSGFRRWQEEGLDYPHSENSTLSPVSLSVTGYYVSAFFLGVIAVLGFLNNMVVICIMIQNKHLRTPLNGLLLNLALSDIGISVIGATFSTVAALQHGWHFPHEFCVTYAFLMSLFGITSITTLTVLSIQRCLMIVRPLLLQDSTNSKLLMTIAAIWAYSTILTAPPLIGWGAYNIEGPGISCSVDWESRSVNSSTYIFFLFTFGLGFPLLIMGLSYSKILKALRNHVTTTTTGTTATMRAERRVTIMVLVMITTFLIAWSPYALFALIVACGYDSRLAAELSIIPAIFAKSSCIYNPVIYVGLNTQFRSAWLNFISCGREQQQQQLQQQQQRQLRLTTEKISITNNSDNNHHQQQAVLPTPPAPLLQVPQQQQQQQQPYKTRTVVVDAGAGDGKAHLTVPMREFRVSSNSNSISEATSVSEMV